MTLNNQIIDQRVRKIAQDHKSAFEHEVGIKNDDARQRSAAFVFLVIKTMFDLNDDDVIDSIVEGGQDFGVDAMLVTPPQDGEFSVTLLQGKYKQDLEKQANFPENGVRGVIDAIKSLFDPSVEIEVNERLKAKVEEVRSFVAEGSIPSIRVVLCNNGSKWNASAEKRITASRLGEQVSWQHMGPDALLAMMQTNKPVNDVLQLKGHALMEEFDFKRVLLGKIVVGQLAALFDRHGDRLLERNIRRYLGLTGNRVNEAVASTLNDESQRPNFYFFNNGITIICSKFRHNALQHGDWQVQLEDLQIVNGGQTSRTVQQVVSQNAAAGTAQVLIRIYELSAEDEELVKNITYATNSQNPVDLRDLRSNDTRQKTLENAINDLGYTYRRQRFEQSVSGRDLTSAVVAEAILAVWRDRPHRARFLTSEHFGKLYERIFTDDLNGAQAITAALLLRIAENRRKRPPSDAPDFLPYASRFIAMLMGKALLKDMNIDFRRLDHRNFKEAEAFIDKRGLQYFNGAVEQIAEALMPFFEAQPRTLQKLSATFRRGDLVETLLGAPLMAV